MRDPRADTQKHGSVEFLAQFKRAFRKFETLGRIGGLEHRNFRADRVMTGILLILGRMHSRIVRDAYNESSVHARIRKREQRIRRDIESDVLHRTGTADAPDGSAEADFRGDFFVRSPFAVNIIVF